MEKKNWKKIKKKTKNYARKNKTIVYLPFEKYYLSFKNFYITSYKIGLCLVLVLPIKWFKSIDSTEHTLGIIRRSRNNPYWKLSMILLDL